MRPSSAANCDKIVEAAVDVSAASTSWCVASGINKVAKIVDQPPDDFLDVMDANVTQSWLMARAAGKQMLAQGRGGKVILMSSARGLLGHPAGYTAYCASKSAVDGITKALGCEWGATGITVNAIGPTVFRSPLTAWMFDDDERGDRGAQGLSRASPKAAWASRPTSPDRCCSSPRRRPTSTPAISSTPTAAIRRAERWTAKARIAVIGAGLMGHGIAQVFALAGHDVTITDPVAAESRHRAGAGRCQPARPRRRRTPPRGARRAPSSPTAVRDADYVVEAVLEDLQLKQKLFAEIERHVRPDTILASNTSVIPITAIMQRLDASARARSAPIGGTRRISCRWSK